MKQQYLRTHHSITMVLSTVEYEWFMATCAQLKVKRTVLLRMGLREIARQLGVPCPIRARAHKTYDRDDPQSGRAWKDRYVLFERRGKGESLKALAAEYDVTTNALGCYFTEINRELGTTIRLEVTAATREAIERVLNDPFQPVTHRTREIALVIMDSTTYEDAAAKLGVSRQRVHQVATLMRKAGNASPYAPQKTWATQETV